MIPAAAAAAAPTCHQGGRDPAPDARAIPAPNSAAPAPRRGGGTGLSARRPVITRYSKKATHHCYPTIHRRRGSRARTLRISTTTGAAHALPIDPFEYQRRIHRVERDVVLAEEPRQIHHVKHAPAHRGTTEPTPAQNAPGTHSPAATRPSHRRSDTRTRSGEASRSSVPRLPITGLPLAASTRSGGPVGTSRRRAARPARAGEPITGW
jgi:hypothetical protein